MIFSQLKRYRDDLSGVAAVEFALIAPVLIFILIGIVDFGLFINRELKIENVARAAAEYVLNGGDQNEVENDIILPSNLGAEIGEVEPEIGYVCECGDGEEVDCDGTCDDEGDYVRRFLEVSMEMGYQTIIPYPGLADNITLEGRVRLQANEE